MQPEVSVVIAVYNEEIHVEEALRSIATQEGVSVEIIVIDDHSTDSTAEKVSRLAEEFPAIRPVRNPRKGKVSAFNHGISLATGTWTALFAGDDIMPPGTLAERVAYAAAADATRPVLGICRLVTLSAIKSQDGHFIPRDPNKGTYSGLSYLMDRRAAAKLFPIPEELPNEDTWLEIAAHHLDLNVVHTPVVGAQWRVHSGNSINLLVGFEEFNRRLTPRMAAAALFLERHGDELSPAQRRALEARVRCEDERKKGNMMGILTSGADLVERLRAVSLSGPVMYGIRRRLYGLFSGW